MEPSELNRLQRRATCVRKSRNPINRLDAPSPLNPCVPLPARHVLVDTTWTWALSRVDNVFKPLFHLSIFSFQLVLTR